MKESRLVEPKKAALPIVGTWRLVGCEISNPAVPYPKSAVTTFAVVGDGLQYRAETTWSDGRHTTAESLFRPDGSWNPITGSSLADSVSMRIVDDRNYEAALKRNGADAGRNRARISSDGRTMVTDWELITPGGVVTMKTTQDRD